MRLLDLLADSVISLPATHENCCICGKKLDEKPRRLSDGKLCCGECYPMYELPIVSYNVKVVKSLQFNSPMQEELRSKLNSTEEISHLWIDRESGYFTTAYKIGPGNPILPISSINGMEIWTSVDGNLLYFYFKTDYERCRRLLMLLPKEGFIQNIPPNGIWDKTNYGRLFRFLNYSQTVRNETISSGGDPSPNIF